MKWFPEALSYASILYNVSYHSKLKGIPLEVATGKKVIAEDDKDPGYLERFKRFGSTCYYDEGIGIFMGFCDDSLSGTILILNKLGNIIRRNALACKFDETFVSRRDLPDLISEFTGYKTLTIADTMPETVTIPIPRSMVGAVGTPEFYHEIRYRDDKAEWLEAMAKEINALKGKGTYDLIDETNVPKDAEILPSRFVFATKRSGLKKARLVAGGHKQTKSLFDDSNGSPTVDIVSLKMFLANAVQLDLKLSSIDFDGAYLNATLDKAIYMRVPHGFTDIEKTVGTKIMKLKKSLYGLKEAGRLWFQMLRQSLKDIGFVSGTFDPCIFTHKSKKLFILVFVDDCIIAGSDTDIAWVVGKIEANFSIKSAPLDDFLGMSIDQLTDGSIELHMDKYIEKAIDELGLTDCKVMKTPLPIKCVLKPAENDDQEAKDVPYLETLGKLLWITKVRPDLDFATNVLCRVAHKPTMEAWTCLKRCFRYLRGTLGFKLKFQKSADTEIWAMSDASFAEDHSYKSHGGCIIYCGRNLVQHYSRIQRLTATSTAESELVEIYRTTNELTFVRGLAQDLGMKFSTSKIFTDSKVIIDVTNGDVLKRRTKHLATKVRRIRDLKDEDLMKLVKIDTEKNVADLMTKQMPAPRFNELRKTLYDVGAFLRRPEDVSAVFAISEVGDKNAPSWNWKVDGDSVVLCFM